MAVTGYVKILVLIDKNTFMYCHGYLRPDFCTVCVKIIELMTKFVKRINITFITMSNIMSIDPFSTNFHFKHPVMQL